MGLAFALGISFIIVFYVANTEIFSGKGSYIFKGFIYYVAIVLVTFVAIKMLNFYNMEKKWKYKLTSLMMEKEEAQRKNRWSIAFLAFSATLREGIEAFLFLTGVSSGQGIKSVIIPSIVGAVLGITAGVIVFWLGKSIKNLKWFFIISTGFLLLIAAGMTQNGTAMFQSAGWFGNTFPYEDVPWSNRILWNTNGCCNPDTNEFWSLIRALFGYQSMPTNIQLLYYCLFWFVVIVGMVFRWRHGKLGDSANTEYDIVDSMPIEAMVAQHDAQKKAEAEAHESELGVDKGLQSSSTAPPPWPTSQIELEAPDFAANGKNVLPQGQNISNPIYGVPASATDQTALAKV